MLKFNSIYKASLQSISTFPDTITVSGNRSVNWDGILRLPLKIRSTIVIRCTTQDRERTESGRLPIPGRLPVKSRSHSRGLPRVVSLERSPLSIPRSSLCGEGNERVCANMCESVSYLAPRWRVQVDKCVAVTISKLRSLCRSRN